jgi:hypothetical protein
MAEKKRPLDVLSVIAGMLLASDEARMLLEHSACEQPSDEVARLLRLARRQEVRTALATSLGGSGTWQSVLVAYADRDRLIRIRQFAERVILYSKAGEEQCASEALAQLMSELKDKELEYGDRLSDPDLAGL